nr:MAG TPA: hypothetical protein [Bacteriophage sp.]
MIIIKFISICKSIVSFSTYSDSFTSITKSKSL